MCGGNLVRFLTISVVTLALPTLCAAVYVRRRLKPGAVPPGMTTRRRREHRLGTRGRGRDGRRRRRSAGGRDGGGSDLDGGGAASDDYGDANSGTDADEEGWSDTGELVQNVSASSPEERRQMYAWMVLVMSALPLQALWLAVLGKRSFLLLELSAYGTCLSPSTTTFSTHTFFFSFVTGSSFSTHSPFTHSALGGRGVACEHRY